MSGKSIEILKVAHNYETQQRHVLLLTSAALDNRSGVGEITYWMQRSALAISDADDLFKLIPRSTRRCRSGLD